MKRSKAVIAGIGQTEFSKDSGRSELQLACEAIKLALDDAGLRPSDVDGFSTFTIDNNEDVDIVRSMGIETLRFSSRTPHGGGGSMATLAHGMAAVEAGLCKTFVCLRAMNERSEARFGIAHMTPTASNKGSGSGFLEWSMPFGAATPAAWTGIQAQAYMARYGAHERGLRADLGPAAQERGDESARLVLPEADHARGSPEVALDRRARLPPARLLSGIGRRRRARHHDRGARPRSAPEARADRPRDAVDPLRHGDRHELLPQGPDGLRQRRPVCEGALRADGPRAPGHPGRHALRPLHVAVFWQLEAMGFCKPGEATDFVKDGHLALDGTIPLSPNGGLIGEAYIHGMNLVTEAVRQIRGTATNQVENVEHVLLSAGMSGAILSKC